MNYFHRVILVIKQSNNPITLFIDVDLIKIGVIIESIALVHLHVIIIHTLAI